MHIRLHTATDEITIENVKTVEYFPWGNGIEFYFRGDDEPRDINYLRGARKFEYMGIEYDFCKVSYMDVVEVQS